MNLYEFYSNPEELNGYEDRVYHIPELAYKTIFSNQKNKYDIKRLEDAISKKAKYSYEYAKDELGGPFPKGEDAIAKSHWYSFAYARYVLKGPFPKGEDAIAKDDCYAFKYAIDVLKGPFPRGEKIIKYHSEYWDEYQQFLERLK